MMTTEVDASPKFDLVAQVLRSGETVRLRAWGVSMVPSIWPGDLLTIESIAPGRVVPGHIVLVLREGRFVIHRLIRTQQEQDCDSWITRGDAVPKNDPPVTASALLGRVTAIRRASRTFQPSTRISPLARALAWMLCYGDRFRSICLRAHAFRRRLAQTG